MFVEFFMERWSSASDYEYDNSVLDVILSLISEGENEELLKPLSMEEIERVI